MSKPNPKQPTLKPPYLVWHLGQNSGVILITVLMLTMVLSLVAIGILGLYVSQIKTSQSVVDTIKAEELAMGAAYREYQCQEWGYCGTSLVPQNLDGKTFTLTTTPGSVTADGLHPFQFSVNY